MLGIPVTSVLELLQQCSSSMPSPLIEVVGRSILHLSRNSKGRKAVLCVLVEYEVVEIAEGF